MIGWFLEEVLTDLLVFGDVLRHVLSVSRHLLQKLPQLTAKKTAYFEVIILKLFVRKPIVSVAILPNGVILSVTDTETRQTTNHGKYTLSRTRTETDTGSGTRAAWDNRTPPVMVQVKCESVLAASYNPFVAVPVPVSITTGVNSLPISVSRCCNQTMWISQDKIWIWIVLRYNAKPIKVYRKQNVHIVWEISSAALHSWAGCLHVNPEEVAQERFLQVTIYLWIIYHP